MHARSLLAACATAAVLSAPALAADINAGPAVDYGPTYACAPSRESIVAPLLQGTFKTWIRRGDRARIVYVEPFDPRQPPLVPTLAYVEPQTAYLASSVCDFAYGEPRRSWYDGKLFYRPGGVRGGPDSFMIIERN